MGAQRAQSAWGRHTRQVLCERPVNDRCEQARFDAIALTPVGAHIKNMRSSAAADSRGAEMRFYGDAARGIAHPTYFSRAVVLASSGLATRVVSVSSIKRALAQAPAASPCQASRSASAVPSARAGRAGQPPAHGPLRLAAPFCAETAAREARRSARRHDGWTTATFRAIGRQAHPATSPGACSHRRWRVTRRAQSRKERAARAVPVNVHAHHWRVPVTKAHAAQVLDARGDPKVARAALETRRAIRPVRRRDAVEQTRTQQDSTACPQLHG